MGVAADRRKPRLGHVLYASALRPATTSAGETVAATSLPSSAVPGKAKGKSGRGAASIPDWDKEALAAAAAAAGAGGMRRRQVSTGGGGGDEGGSRSSSAAGPAPPRIVEVGCDLLIGADGADSFVRQRMKAADPKVRWAVHALGYRSHVRPVPSWMGRCMETADPGVGAELVRWQLCACRALPQSTP